jgi:hypothetical protein
LDCGGLFTLSLKGHRFSGCLGLRQAPKTNGLYSPEETVSAVFLQPARMSSLLGALELFLRFLRIDG